MKTNVPSVEISNDKELIKKQIQALECVLTIDTRDIDKEIHTQALNSLKNALNA